MFGSLKHKKQPAAERRLSNSVFDNGTGTSDVLLGTKNCSLCVLFSSWLGCSNSPVDNAIRHHTYMAHSSTLFSCGNKCANVTRDWAVSAQAQAFLSNCSAAKKAPLSLWILLQTFRYRIKNRLHRVDLEQIIRFNSSKREMVLQLSAYPGEDVNCHHSNRSFQHLSF